jgi:hypothetical protein
MSILKKLAVLTIALCTYSTTLSVFGQTPGGVNTNSNIRFWFDGGSFRNTPNGTAIQTWNGRGSNTIDLTQSSSSSRPQLLNNPTDRINGIPVLRFDGVNDALLFQDNNDINLGTHHERTYHLVFRTGNDVNSTQVLYEEGGSTRGISMYLHNGEFYVSLWNHNNDGPASPWNTLSESFTVSSNTVYIASLVYDGGTVSNNGTASLYRNGTLEGTITSIGTLYEHPDDNAIGRVTGTSRTHFSNSYSTPSYYQGDIAEIIIANYAQNTNDHQLTIDALAAKYNITPAVNLYNGDTPANGNHDHEVFSMRRDASGNENASANSGGIISSSNASNLGNAEHLIIGQNNGSASWTSTETHNPTFHRIEREWYVDEAGDVGTVTLTIDGNKLPPNGHTISLLVDADGDFSSGATAYNTTPSGNNYTVSVNLNNGDHLTIAAILPQVSVSTATQTVAENSGTGMVTFEIDQILSTNTIVSYSVANGSAQNGTDYVMSNGTTTILAGNATATASFDIILDCITESTESFSVTITNAGSVGTATQTISITDANNSTNGPAGTSCGLEHWFKPDAGVTVVSGRVDQWVDQENAIPADASVSSNRPRYRSSSTDNTFNYQPYLEFDGNNDALGLDNSLSTNSINAVYGFVVFRTDFSGSNYNSNWSFLDYDRSEYFNYYLRGDNGQLGWSFYNDSQIRDNQGNTALNDDRPHIGTFIFDNSQTNDTRLYADGALNLSADVAPANTTIGKNSTRYAFIGNGSEATAQNGDNNGIYYDGDIAEILYFSEPLNPKQINIMHTHLGLKYGINLTMANDASTAGFDERNYHNSSETVIWNYASNTNYANAKAGIIRDDNAPLTVTKSTSTGAGSIVTIETSSLNNNTSLVWGHNGATTASSSETPDGYSERFNRVWKADEVGETGTLTISFDLTGISGLPESASEFALLIDDNGNFNNASTHTTGANLSGNTLTFTNVDLDDADYFTLGYWTAIVWNGSNWSNGSGTNGAPNLSDGTRKLIINGNGGTLNNNASVGSVEITGSSDLTVNTGITLEVANGIENNGSITVLNGGSILQTESGNTNSGSGNYEVRRNTGFLQDDTRFQYWSSPVQNATMGSTFPGSNTTDFYYFNESNQGWTTQATNATMTPGRGYITTGTIGISTNNETRNFDGSINNGPITLTTSSVSNGDNILVGNPYPSAINNQLFIDANPELLGTLWFWNHSTEQNGGGSSGTNNQADYATWTSLGSTGGTDGTLPDDYIQSAQGFFVQATGSNPSISFTNSQRIGGNNLQFFKNSNVETRNRAWLAISNDSNDFNQILVGFATGATDGFDRLYDGKKFKAHPRVSLYSVAGSEQLSIQALAKPPINGTKKIPLGVDAWITGDHTIYLDSLNNWGANLSLVLEDVKLHTSINLKEQNSYTFTVDSIGSIQDRFYLNVTHTLSGNHDGGIELPDSSDVSTNVGNVETDNFTIYSLDQELILTGDTEIKHISLYDVSGRLVLENSINATSARIPVNFHGVYLIHITFGNNKVAIHKLKL